MTSFLRFFLLALTPLLGVTVTFGPSFSYGLVATLVLTGVATLVFFVRDRLKETALLWSALGLAAVLVTAVDLVTGIWLPGVRAAWGIYLNLLAFSPLAVVVPLEKAKAEDLGSELSVALKTGLLLTLLFTVTALVRELLGRGSLTLVPGVVVWTVPGLKAFPLTILATGAGGFFLAATGVVVYRALRPRWARMAAVTGFLSTEAPTPARVGQGATGSEPIPEPTSAPVPESSGDWGETMTSTVADLASSLPSHEKRRLLVIGSGNGELTYYLAMLCLDQAKGERAFDFRVRGVDHFSTRVETALRGVYRDHQVEMVPQPVREAWMTRGQGDERHLWKVGAEPRAHVEFEVADFQQGQMFFGQPNQVTVLNQGIEYVTDDKKAQLLARVCEHLTPGGALVVTGPLKRELLPEGMKRTGTSVFRKA